ncbi:hypothetical protein [Rhizobium paknamense]|uniref:Anti-sigma factor NepR domain-containing protein n=1 Tax=Rhizobium paknamense TaxID=1206817 RepID=A0ABU0IBJ8_9HYPH|nr:hypothetical protein [Rhizobium paknamense]MDQ0455576.1 hypothetical protein [Rhizobium paknamense]
MTDKTKDIKVSSGGQLDLDSKLQTLLHELESATVPPRILELAKELQAALDAKKNPVT